VASITKTETVVEVDGDLDLATAPDWCAKIEDTFRTPGAHVLVDLSRLSFCDSTGLRALIGVAREAQVHDVPLRIIPPTGAGPRRALELAGALEFLPIV
jgi:anti-sigma B factor antagonist